MEDLGVITQWRVFEPL